MFVSKVLANNARFYSVEYELYILSFTIIILSLSKISVLKYFFLLPIFIFSVLYTPVGVMYGLPNIGIVASLLTTNLLETGEFIESTPSIIYIYLLLGILIAYIYIKIDFITPQKVAGKSLAVFIGALLLYSYHSPIKDWINAAQNAVKSYDEFIENFTNIENPMNLQVTSVNPKYDTYVLIIGESARKDYMSVYGYPINTTPFFKKTNGLFIDGFISAAPNSVGSLTRMFSFSTGISIEPKKNIIDFAKQGGFETYWLSNQGFLGKQDTLISKIATLSKHVKMLKSGDYESSNTMDDELIPYFEKVINSNINRNHKLIILHLMGSHPRFCNRVSADIYNLENKDLSCYLSSITQTDNFLRKIFNLLKKSGESFSMMYLSDHGLNNYADKGNILRVGVKHKSNYEIPFARLSSDDNNRIIQKKPLSGFKFIHFFLDWLGINSNVIDSINVDNYKEEEAIQIFNWSEMQDFSELKDDPANLYPEKK